MPLDYGYCLCTIPVVGLLDQVVLIAALARVTHTDEVAAGAGSLCPVAVLLQPDVFALLGWRAQGAVELPFTGHADITDATAHFDQLAALVRAGRRAMKTRRAVGRLLFRAAGDF